MKKLLLIVFAVLGSMAVNAQDNVVKINPLSILGGSDLISYERYLTDHTSGVISAGFGGFKIGGFKYKSAGAGLQYRYYLSESLFGFYGGAVLAFHKGKVESKDELNLGTASDTKFSSFGGGLKVGYQWIWDSGFSLDLNLGASYKKFNYDSTADESSIGLKGNGIGPTLGLGLGYAF